MLTDLLRQRGVQTIEAVDARTMRALRKEYREILLREEYGQPIPEPEQLSFEELPTTGADRRFAAGRATCKTVIVHTVVAGKEFSFPFQALIPNEEGRYPFVIYNDFFGGVPTKYCPAEEILERGFALFHLDYQDVTSDDGDFSNGLAGVIYDSADGAALASDAPGKLAMWAWANMRLMDYALTLSCIDPERGAVAGHSRLGKAALLTGLLDERFRYIIANNSGCSGDALARGNTGEQIADITRRFPYWFCPNYLKYADVGYGSFDQHMLLAALAPRTVFSGAAAEDAWADPISQYLSCVAASNAWRAFGEKGLEASDRLPRVGDRFHDGHLCYHLRAGTHYFSRTDWNFYLDRIQK